MLSPRECGRPHHWCVLLFRCLCHQGQQTAALSNKQPDVSIGIREKNNLTDGNTKECNSKANIEGIKRLIKKKKKKNGSGCQARWFGRSQRLDTCQTVRTRCVGCSPVTDSRNHGGDHFPHWQPTTAFCVSPANRWRPLAWPSPCPGKKHPASPILRGSSRHRDRQCGRTGPAGLRWRD